MVHHGCYNSPPFVHVIVWLNGTSDPRRMNRCNICTIFVVFLRRMNRWFFCGEWIVDKCVIYYLFIYYLVTTQLYQNVTSHVTWLTWVVTQVICGLRIRYYYDLATRLGLWVRFLDDSSMCAMAGNYASQAIQMNYTWRRGVPCKNI